MVLVDDAALADRRTDRLVPHCVVERRGLLGVRRNLVAREDEARVEHAAPVVPVREVADEARVRELLVDDLLHRPVDVLDVREVRDGVERAERLRNVEHIARVEELVLVLPPPLAALRAQVLAVELLLHDFACVLHLEVYDLLAAVEAEDEVRALVEVDAEDLRDMRFRLGLVVETHRARAETRAHERRASLHRGVEVLEDVGAELPGLGLGMDLERHLGYDAERALAAEEHHREVRARRVARDWERANDLARRGDDFQGHHHVLDLAVLRREDASPAVREEAADRGARDRGGKVHRRKPFLVAAPLEVLRDDAGLRRDGERLLVDLDDLVHALHVKDDSVVDRKRTSLRTGASAPRNDWDLVLVRDLHNARDLLSRRGMDNEVGLRAFPAAVVPHLGNPIVVDGVAELVRELHVHVIFADDVGEFRPNHLEHVAVRLYLHCCFLPKKTA